MAKQVNPSKSRKSAKSPAGGKAVNLPSVTPFTSLKIQTTSWGGAMGYSDGGTIHWNDAFMHTILSVKLPRFEVGLPNQPITFNIRRESGRLHQTINCTTDKTGYCSATVKGLPIDPSLNPDGDGQHWERYTFESRFEETNIYSPSGWTQRVWLSDSVTQWNLLSHVKKGKVVK